MFFSKDLIANEEPVEQVDPDLALIRRHTHRDVKAEDVWCGALHSANTKLDRSGERFTKAYLERFRDTFPGKALLEGHSRDRRPLGRIYKAEVLPDGDGHFLKTYFYVKADSPLVDEIELGIAKDCSIGYNAARRVCDLDGKEWHPYRKGDRYCQHEPLQEYGDETCTLTYCDSAVGKAEAMEMSLVWHGCQFDAQAVAKSFDGGEVAFLKDLIAHSMAAQRLQGLPESGTGAPQPMTIEEVQAELQQTKAAHQTEAAKWQQEQAELKRQAADGDWGRKHLSDEIVRMAGALKRTETYAVILKALGEKPSVEQLLPIYEEIGKEYDEKFSRGQGQIGGAPGPEEVQRTETVAVPWYRPLRRTA